MFESPSPALDVPFYVYGFSLRPPSSWPLGIAGPVQWVRGEPELGLGAIAEAAVDLALLQAQADCLLQAVVTHDQVLQAIFAQEPVLPLRFGTVFPHRAALETYLSQSGAPYRAELLALGDRAEYHLQATPLPWAAPPLPTATTGRAYFLAKKAQLQAQGTHHQRQQHQWREAVTGLMAQFPTVLGPEEDTPQSIYLLASRSGQDLEQALHTLQTQAPDWTFCRSEPLPPYHFPTIPREPRGPSPRSLDSP